MPTFDTIKILTNIDTLTSFDDVKFIDKGDHNFGTKNGHRIDQYKVQNIGYGINELKVDMVNSEVTMRLSGKVLKSDYAKGINTSTFERVIDEVNKTGFIQLDTSKVYNEGQVLSVDVVDHIDITDHYYSRLAKVPFGKMYDTTSYSTSRNEGIVISGKHKTFKCRQIHYDKLKDLTKDTTNRKFMTDYGVKFMKSFTGKVRIETNLTSFKTIRDYLTNDPCSGAPSIKQVFESTTKPKFRMFDKMTSSVQLNMLSLFDQYESMTLWHELKLRGIRGIIDDLGRDWSTIERYIKHRSKHNYRRYRKEFKQVYADMTERKTDYKQNIVEYINQELSKCA